MDRNTSNHGEGEVKEVRKVIMVVLVAVMLGYTFMWIMMPTATYRYTWSPNIKTKLNSTYFGTQGAQLLIYTFPVLFVAVLGCIYLHLGKKSINYVLKRKEKEEKSLLSAWRRPVLVRGPLGIVSGVELSFFVMFIALVVWSFSNFLHVAFARLNPAQIEEDGGQRWKAKWDITVFRLGLTGNICLTMLFFPVTRGSSILPLFGLTSEGCIKYHIWVGHIVMALFTGHGIGFLLLWAVNGELSQALKWDKVGESNVAGELSLLSGLILWVATYPKIRRKMFEVFFYTHHLYILFVFFFVLHVGMSYASYMLPGFFLFMIDRYIRFLQSRQRVRLLSARALPWEAIELTFAKNPRLIYNPTSIMFVNVPSISKLQWHPFTISSSGRLEQDKISVVIKVEGTWTRKLYDVVSSSSIDRLEVSVEGPYGPHSSNFLRHDTLIMVSGGSGITPFISIIRELIFASTILKCQTPKLLLISSFKKSTDLSMLETILPLSGTPFDLSNLDLQIKAYVTREKGSQGGDSQDKNPRTIWFKPNASDAPISATLGENGWLWLGAIIASSFVAFLIFMGILTQYYIYPIDKNTNDIFSTSQRAVLQVLILCVCIAMAASAAVLWNKKRNAMETKQIISMEGITPKATPDSGFYNADRELESLPHQSLRESTQVFYGERPDLKRLLFDCKGSNVGVLVCGPHGMRREVAAICASGLADNLHFESISFSW